MVYDTKKAGYAGLFYQPIGEKLWINRLNLTGAIIDIVQKTLVR